MNKKQVINKLCDLQCEIAEVICDISSNGEVCYPNESIIVLLVDTPSNDDLIINSKHWTICCGIDDFNEGIIYGEKEAKKAKKAYCRYYVSKFIEVKPFVTDFK